MSPHVGMEQYHVITPVGLVEGHISKLLDECRVWDVKTAGLRSGPPTGEYLPAEESFWLNRRPPSAQAQEISIGSTPNDNSWEW